MNPLTPEERRQIREMQKRSLSIGEVWELLSSVERRQLLSYVLDQLPEWSRIERAVNGDIPFESQDYTKADLIDEILDGHLGGEGNFASCVNCISGFENATRDIMFEMIMEGQVTDMMGETYS